MSAGNPQAFTDDFEVDFSSGSDPQYSPRESYDLLQLGGVTEEERSSTGLPLGWLNEILYSGPECAPGHNRPVRAIGMNRRGLKPDHSAQMNVVTLFEFPYGVHVPGHSWEGTASDTDRGRCTYPEMSGKPPIIQSYHWHYACPSSSDRTRNELRGGYELVVPDPENDCADSPISEYQGMELNKTMNIRTNPDSASKFLEELEGLLDTFSAITSFHKSVRGGKVNSPRCAWDLA